MISPLAHVDATAKIGKNVTIHPFAFIDKNVEIGDDCEIMPYASVINGTKMGCRNKVYQGAVVGADPQDFRWKGEEARCTIGNDNVIREHVIINRGFETKEGTVIGDFVFIMANSHVGHDCKLAGQSVLGNGVTMAGNVEIGANVILSSNSIFHEDSKVGDWTLVKGGCRVSGNVPPFIIVAHNPVEYFGVNAYVMRKHGYTDDQVDDIAKAYRHVYQSGTSVFNALKRIEADVEPSAHRDAITDFIRKVDLKIVAVPVELE
ncbi:MAG: acyl-ACP--UDP-N-acetylglucosamine O-acyltransferase [Barnesiella sp.]|nr:acyl-ACP--UDP-N-acetylglucosamine O-acyltransferase [Barnesiella sp.]MBD5246748.1 acyl-ACP--UDP-N-acetylglucosamine O-acyltransferase [Barnesiella sp.]MBD5258162.1 acyl-ACP--UDP-N-acetylglucosamine O-acyltransferase [Barnesiella sp.]